MFKHQWAAIVYGRSYHLDFRFITIPQDFTEQEKSWAANYILATFRQANKLSSRPRWSLFKNESHCILGVTCMVRDLLNDLEPEAIERLSKDNFGRPLYVFVGYVTQLKGRKSLADFPTYTDCNLQYFQELYQYISDVWWVEEYYEDSKKPIFNGYQTLDFHNQETHNIFELAGQINHQKRYPERTYIWQNTTEQKQKLWVTAAVCYKPISICLGEQSVNYLKNSPFLNQTATIETPETIADCAITTVKRNGNSEGEAILSPQKNLSQVIRNKVKADIDFTLHQAKIAIEKSRNLFSKPKDRPLSLSLWQSQISQKDRKKERNFGLKAKSKSTSDRDWFET